jgi:hypothetical protein
MICNDQAPYKEFFFISNMPKIPTNIVESKTVNTYMGTFRREHFSPNFEGAFRPSRQLSKSSAREKNKVQ